MPTSQPVAELNTAFSEPDATAPTWAGVSDVLARSEMFWLSTVRGDGRPHVTPLPAMWLDGALHFCAGAHEQKAKNIASNPQCILTTGTNELRTGLDVVVEGSASRVTDQPTLRRLAAMWKSKIDWDFDVREDGFRDGADRVGLVFAVNPTKVLAFGKGPFTQTRFRFGG